MNRILPIGFVLVSLVLSQCRVTRELLEPEPPRAVGIEGLRAACLPADTIRNIFISKAEALITSGDERYESQVSVYAVRDSLIYFSAINSGFEILRGAIDPDSIRVIDRLNKIVYTTPVRRRFGYSHPVTFTDIQNLVSTYFLCDDLEKAQEVDFSRVIFSYGDELVKKEITLGRESLRMETFEFYHTETHKYLMGERKAEGFVILSNFIISEFEVRARGGELSFNRNIPVKMEVNRNRYSFVQL
jgi:hypothetical protein